MRVAAVNCDDDKALCTAAGVRGYPTIKALVPGSRDLRDYGGDRSAKSIADWALGLVPGSHVSVVDGQKKKLEDFLATCTPGGKAKGRAAWDVCAILVTDKTTTSALYKALSTAYSLPKPKISFAEVRVAGSGKAAGAALADQLLGSGAKLPKLVTVCNGDVALKEVYSGELKSEALNKHLASFAGGRKCAQAIQLSRDTDFTKLSATQLKQLIRDKGLACAGCSEKADFVRVLQEYVAKL